MPKLTEVFVIKEGDVVPFKKGGATPPPPSGPSSGAASQALQKLSDRAEGLMNTDALEGLKLVAKQIDQLPATEPESKMALHSFATFVQALGKAVELI